MTRFHFAGRYNDDPNSLITHEHEPGYIPFKEAQTMNKLAVVMNGIAIIIAFIVLALYYFLAKAPLNILGLIASIIVLVPHEFLHAICFEGDVYMYENLRKGMLFVVGPGTFSKAGFIFMSMLPNIVFGFIPFIIFLFDHSNTFMGTLGAISIASGAGDYYNAYNALTQMPDNARTYLHGINNYWYIPENRGEDKPVKKCF